jgi:DNA-binding response OmpR family regulator
VLLVEDEGSLRSVVGDVLRGNGYVVLDAPDGKAAIEVAKGFESPIDLLLTDVILPGISGRSIADELLLSRPSMKVIYMSGYTDEFIAEHGIIDPRIVLLEKPFRMSALLLNIRELLDGSPAKIN